MYLGLSRLGQWEAIAASAVKLVGDAYAAKLTADTAKSIEKARAQAAASQAAAAQAAAQAAGAHGAPSDFWSKYGMWIALGVGTVVLVGGTVVVVSVVKGK